LVERALASDFVSLRLNAVAVKIEPQPAMVARITDNRLQLLTKPLKEMLMSKPLYDIPVRKIDGTEASLGDYKGDVMLVVNVASKCGLTPQYTDLEAIYEQYRDRGLVVLGFPANQFAGQEPGSNDEIKQFCETKYAVKFPLFEKIVVKGEGQHPLYQQLISDIPHAQQNPAGSLRKTLDQHGLGPTNDTDIMWNFEKFLVDRQGKVVGRFAPDIAPKDPALTSAIEAELAKPA
jgi:glutathione peroxidase